METKQTKNGIILTIKDSDGNVYKSYRYTKKEVDYMKHGILGSIQNEREGVKTAWRWRLAISINDYSNNRAKSRKASKRIMLYNFLTKNDLPQWENWMSI